MMAVCCSVLQCVAVFVDGNTTNCVLQCIALFCSALQYLLMAATSNCVLQCAAVLQCVAVDVDGSVLQYVVVCCSLC